MKIWDETRAKSRAQESQTLADRGSGKAASLTDERGVV